MGLFFLFKRGWKIVKGKVKIEAPENNFKKFFFYIGGFFLIVSSIILLSSFVFLLQGSVGVGMGVGFSVLPFILGIILIEACKNKVNIKSAYNKSLKNDAASSTS
jgi:hypothetical protein